MNARGWLKLLLLFAFFAGGGYYLYTQHFVYFNREADLRSIARTLGLKYKPIIDGRPRVFGLEFFEFFKTGSEPEYSNYLNGQVNSLRVYVFDYKYRRHKIKGRKVSLPNESLHQTIIALKRDGSTIPTFTMYPKTKFSNLTKLFSQQEQQMKTLRFRNQPKLDKNYLVLSYKSTTYHAFNSTVVKFFEDNPGLVVRSTKGFVLFYFRDYVMPASKLKSLLLQTMKVYMSIATT